MALTASEDFKKLVEKRAHELGLSLREIARRADISVSSVSRILAGDRGLPGNDVLQRIADALELPYDQLLVAAGTK